MRHDMKKCGAHNVIHGERETCPMCADAARVKAVSNAPVCGVYARHSYKELAIKLKAILDADVKGEWLNGPLGTQFRSLEEHAIVERDAHKWTRDPPPEWYLAQPDAQTPEPPMLWAPRRNGGVIIGTNNEPVTRLGYTGITRGGKVVTEPDEATKDKPRDIWVVDWDVDGKACLAGVWGFMTLELRNAIRPHIGRHEIRRAQYVHAKDCRVLYLTLDDDHEITVFAEFTVPHTGSVFVQRRDAYGRLKGST